MSESSSRQSLESTPGQRWNLVQRRIALTLLLILLACAAGGTQGPWWTVTIGETTMGDGPMDGNEYRRWKLVPRTDATGPLAKYAVERQEQALRPANVALLAIMVGAMIALWNLAADATVMWPLLLCTLVVAGVAGFVIHDVVVDESILKEFVQFKEAKHYAGSGSAAKGKSPEATLRVGWGLALFVSSALVMLIDAVYLTVVARRAGKST